MVSKVNVKFCFFFKENLLFMDIENCLFFYDRVEFGKLVVENKVLNFG